MKIYDPDAHRCKMADPMLEALRGNLAELPGMRLPSDT